MFCWTSIKLLNNSSTYGVYKYDFSTLGVKVIYQQVVLVPVPWQVFVKSTFLEQAVAYAMCVFITNMLYFLNVKMQKNEKQACSLE